MTATQPPSPASSPSAPPPPHSPAEAAARAGNAITCLPSPAVSEAVLAGPDGLLAGLPSGGTWIEMSTNGRDEIIRLAALAAAKGVDTLECPVTGGVHLAAAGKITALVGGDPALYERHRAAIEAMCARSFLMGPVGSAAVIKVITNMLAFIHLVAAGEALMLAKRAGSISPRPITPSPPRRAPASSTRPKASSCSTAPTTSASPWISR